MYRNTWRTSDHGVSLINKLYPDACTAFDFKSRDLNLAVRKDPYLQHCEIIFGQNQMTMGYIPKVIDVGK